MVEVLTDAPLLDGESYNNLYLCCDASAVLQAIYIGEAWISVGFSTDGNMVGSDAVIGLPDDGSVMEYDLTTKVKSFP